MGPFAIALIVLACVIGGIVVGVIFRRILPAVHLQEESKDAIRVGTGLIATLTALVLGLLVGAAKSSYDAVDSGITQCSAKIASLDRLLAQYGSEAKDVRDQLRLSLAVVIDEGWPEAKVVFPGPKPTDNLATMEAVDVKLRAMTPQNDSQRWLLGQAMQISNDLAQSYWQILEQTHGSLPTPFLVILVFWMSILFASFSLFAPPNATVTAVFVLCAISVAGAVFLMLEMSNPGEGLMKISCDPLMRAFAQLGH